MTTIRQEERILKLLIAQIQQVPAEEIREIQVGKARKVYKVLIAGGYLATLDALKQSYFFCTTFNVQKKIEKVFSIEINSPERVGVFYRAYSNHFRSCSNYLQSQNERRYNNLRETYLTLQIKCYDKKIISRAEALDKYQDELNALEDALLSK